ncbi:MAG: hypothetical protein WC050_03130 [Candidatus Paceibacterota bacterium]
MVNLSIGHGREKVAAIVDIQAGGAMVTIVKNPHEGPSTIATSARSTLSLEPRTMEQSIGSIAQQVKEAGERALSVYTEEGHTIPVHTVYVIVHAPWARTVTARSSERLPEDLRVHDELIASIAQRSLKESAIDRSVLLEASVVGIELNGYHTSDPAGKYAHTVDVVSLFSECDAVVKSSILAALQALFPVAEVQWRSSARAIVSLLRSQAIYDRLIVDMGAESSQIISLRAGTYEERIVPVGVRTILSRVGGGRMPDEILGHLRMLSRDACSNDACEAVEKGLAVSEPDLAHVFGDAIGQLAAHKRVAVDLLLITHPDLESWLSTFFSRIDFSQFTVTTLPFSVHNTDALVAPYVELTEAAQESASLIGAALVNMEAHQS